MFLFNTLFGSRQPASDTPPLETAMRKASEKTGVSFDYLMATAKRESGLKTDAKAPTSSASGLFQFVEQTWLSLVRKDGAEQGLGAEAAQIQQDSRGRLTVSDSSARAKILDLRNDPDVASRFAGVLASRNRDSLASAIGRDPAEGELYIAHFLGSNAAAQLIRLKDSAPGTAAAAQFSTAAAANRNVFYDRQGRARSVGEVYARLVKGFSAETAVAAARPADVAATPVAQASGNPFHGLFRNGGTQPVSNGVAQTWLPLANAANRQAALPGAIGAPLDLLSFVRARG